MEPTPPSSGDTHSPEIPSFDTLLATGASSFTALLGLTPSIAVELLHDSVHPPAIPPYSGGDVCRLPLPLGCSPTFPSYVALVDWAARLSVFTDEESPNVERSPLARLKAEPADSVDRPVGRNQRLTGKRKGGGGGGGGGSKMNMSKTGGVEEEEKKSSTGGDEKPLPYVHVRARRGQATDSHSLAERARREKINARMKLLQELVPGCNKISGTALVLDEIINHVQSLQRQVEFLSMQLAAVNPRVDFSSLDTVLPAECVQLMAGDGRNAMGLEQSSPWSMTDGTTNGNRQQQQQQQQQQLWQVDLVQQQEQLQQWERDETGNLHHQQQQHGFIEQPGSSPFPSYDSAGSVSISNQLKTEL